MTNKQDGVVVAVDGVIAKVKTSRHNNCENCGACPGNSAIVLDAQNPVGAKAGQRVEIEIREAGMLKAAFVVFLLPLIAVFAGVMAAGYVAEQLGYNVFGLKLTGALLALALALAYVKHFDRSAKSDAGGQPVITRVL